jgi:dimethylglycine dehydrogenase
MKTQTRVVVIGGGVIGTSILYHLAKYGWEDVMLIEKHELTSGSTWMAAGNCSFFHGDYYCTRVNMKSVELYKGIEEETGQSPGWHTTGSIRTADNPGRMEELGYMYSMNRCLGLDVSWVTPQEIADLHPLMNVDGLLGGLYWPDDGDVDPSSVTQAMAIGARKYGGEIVQNNRVTGLTRKPNDEWVVHTEQGDVTCEYVVNAAGLWAPQVAAMAGIEIPSIAGEHSHILFEAIDIVKDRDSFLPLVRDPDRSIYIRQEMDSLILGLYEHQIKQWYPEGVPWDYSLTELTPDIDHISDFIENGIHRFPVMGETGFKHVTVGPITYTPNGNPLVGPAYPLKNYFLACGYSFGVTQSGGIGHYVAGWIMNGEPELDMWPMDSRRYGSYANWAYNHEKIEDTYPRLYSIIYANEWRDAARPNRTSPIYEYQKQAGAVFGDYFGWECPNYFTTEAADQYERPGWNRTNSFKYVGQECRHVRDHVGLVDLTRFAKTWISGPGAEAWLEKMTCQQIPKTIGTIALSPMLDKNGAFKSDMTVTKIRDNEYFLITASVGKRHDQHWLLLNLPKDGSVLMEDITYQMGCFVIAGPKSRDLLAKVVYGDVSATAFPFATTRELYVGRTKCTVNRMNYMGELGYEIFHPIESQIAVYQTLMAVKDEFNLKMIGMHAMESMRLEKGYLAWKAEMNLHHTPLETDIAWVIKWNKDFIGKPALEKIKAEGIKQKQVAMVVEAENADPWGYNPIFNGDQQVGMTSSGGYGHRLEKSIALGYIPPELAKPGTELQVEVLGKKLPATVVAMPLYDPKNERMKA